jgi:cyclopropane fatty-acyl-phospholipid synthase-like methyltransferase
LELGCGGGQAAVATANLGSRFEVTGIELDRDLAEYASKLARSAECDHVRILHDDFYSIELDEQFDMVCYWDSFGIGTDHEQRLLLNRVGRWLSPEGRALIDIMSTSAAVERRGTLVEVIPGKVSREFSYDDYRSRLIDKWRTSQREIIQSFRTYNPEDFRILTLGTGLELERALAPYVFTRELQDSSNESLRTDITWLALLKASIQGL